MYLTERKLLIGAEHQSSKDYQKWLLTLSAGALGVSMAFLKDIVPVEMARWTGWMLAAWILFALSIVAVMVSIRLSERAHEEYRDILDQEWAAGGDEVWERIRTGQERVWKVAWIDWLGMVSLILFVLGIIFLAVFAYVNLGVASAPAGKGGDAPARTTDHAGRIETLEKTDERRADSTLFARPIPMPERKDRMAPARQDTRHQAQGSEEA